MTFGKWLVLVLMLFASGTALAGGGQERGDKGQGAVVQTQVRPPDPPAPTMVESEAAPVAEDETEEETGMF